jgi:hypothetical protein
MTPLSSKKGILKRSSEDFEYIRVGSAPIKGKRG